MQKMHIANSDLVVTKNSLLTDRLTIINLIDRIGLTNIFKRSYSRFVNKKAIVD